MLLDGATAAAMCSFVQFSRLEKSYKLSLRRYAERGEVGNDTRAIQNRGRVRGERHQQQSIIGLSRKEASLVLMQRSFLRG
jgi:hypothetical protein